MDEKLKCVNEAATFICREIGDHVHYPPARVTRSSRLHHAPSSIHYTGLESTFGITRKLHYGQCRKNQAAGVGSIAYDGCGEFVRSTAEEDSMNCVACSCHRSFHEEKSLNNTIPIYQKNRIRSTDKENVFTEAVLKVLKRSSHQLQQILSCPYGSKVEEKKPSGVDLISKYEPRGGDVVEKEEGIKVKRLKTKFSAEQTEKMRNYAKKLQWKINPENRDEVEQFCSEIGVELQKFRVWMRNHKDKN